MLHPKRVAGSALVVSLVAVLLLPGCGGGKKQVEVIAKASPPLGRVIVVGFDGIDPEMIGQFVAEGVMPNTARLIEQGAFGGLMSTLPPSSASAWTSAFTGVNPGKHGIYGFMGQPAPDAEGNIVFNTSLQRGFNAVWQMLGQHGLRSTVINIPLTSPADSLNGLMVAGFPHASEDTSTFFWPRSLRQELTDYTFDAFRVMVAKDKEDRFIQKMEGIESKRLEVGLRLLDRHDWDLFWIVFTFTDRYQHYLWKYWDKNHPMYDPVGGAQYGGAIRDAYVMADAYLGKFMDKMEPNDLLVLMSDHGFGRLYWTVNAQNFIYRTLGPTREVVCADFFGAKFKMDVTGPNAEERYKSIRDRMIEGLRTFEDPARGVRIIDSIYVKEQIYTGPYLSKAPDIVCLENPDYVLFTLSRTPDLRVIDAGPAPDRAFSGFHRRRGTIGLYGSQVLAGQAFEARIVDITAIILAYLGVPAPSELDGRVPVQVFKNDLSPGLNLAKSNETGFRRPDLFVAQDSKAMEKQLRAVGYIQ